VRFLILICLSFLLSTSFLSTSAQANRQLVDGIAAQVGNRVILFSDVIKLTGPTEQKMRAAGASSAEILRLRTDVLDHLIDRKLVEEVIERSNLTATEIEVDQTIEGIAEENNLTLESLRTSVEAEGLSYESYREKIRTEIEGSRVLNSQVRSRVRIEEEEVAILYEKTYAKQPMSGDEYRLQQLMVPKGVEKTDAVACEAIHESRDLVRKGATYKQISEANPALRFTQFDWIHQDQLATWMEDAVASSDGSALGEIVRADFGCVLLQVLEKRHYEPVTFEMAEEKLYEQLYNQQMDVAYADWLDEVREETYVEKKGIFAHQGLITPESPSGE
jgi:peptidyl-prolyl cis-trans isomerase SurA